MRSTTNYVLRANGEDFAQAFKVKSILVLHEANRISRAKIKLLDGSVSEQDFPLSNMDFFKPGKTFEIAVGYEGDAHSIFKGIITRHGIRVNKNNTSFLEIECKHKAIVLAQNPKNRFFYNQTDKDAITQILNEKDIEYETGTWPDFENEQLIQAHSTDWDFILSRTRFNGLLLITEEDRLHFVSPNIDEEEVLVCRYGSNVLEFEALMDTLNQSSSITSSAWSPEDQEIIETEGTSSFENELGNLDADTLGSMWENDITQLQHTAALKNEELQVWSNARATYNQISKIAGRVRVRGTHEVLPGKVIKLEGLGERFTGKALVTAVRHELQDGSWTNDIQFGLQDGLFDHQSENKGILDTQILSPVKGCYTAVVTQLENDPEGNNRIKVKIPLWESEDDGIWARLIAPYAGEEYGISFYPELGDEVVVGFLNEDPRHPIILGSLHSSNKPAHILGEDDNNIKGIKTRSGLQLIFDDDQKNINIETPAGNKVMIQESDKSISVIDEHDNSIIMNSDGITMESKKDIKITATKDLNLEAVNIAIKASGKFSAEGNAGADLTSSAIAVLKGSLVQIN